MEIGEKIYFGNYQWRVLAIQGDTALLITETIIEQRAYHDTYKDVDWANCSLRKYLNGDFYEYFTNEEQAKILTSLNKNLDNQWYGTTGGGDTADKVFLLSIEEVTCHYFGDSSDKLYYPKKNKRYWFERKDPNNHLRIAKFEDKQIWWWWLRSPGRLGIKAAYVHGDGNIGIQGNNILKGNVGGPFHNGDSQGGVRPALWIKFK